MSAVGEAIQRGQRRRSHDELIADVQAGAQRLSIASRSWGNFPPGAAALDEAANCCEGLRRTLGELRAFNEEVGSTGHGK